MKILPYTFINAERLKYGRFPLLDTVFYRWSRRIEETLFQQAGVEVYAGSSVTEEMKFSAFFSMLRQPRPIYFFTLAPFSGNSLLVLDNRFAAFCLRQQAGERRVRVDAKLSPSNQARLQQVVRALMKDFDHSWSQIHDVESRLTKITTIPFRARILNPYEHCLVAQIHLSGRGISSRIIWCIPTKTLQPELERLKQSKVLPPVGLDHGTEEGISRESLLSRLHYGMQVRVGDMALGDLKEPLEVGQVLPLNKPSDAEALASLDGTPSLVGSIGQVGEHIALKINRAYAPQKPSMLADAESFQPMQWPPAQTD